MANPEVAYEHAGTAKPTVLAAPMSDSDLTFTVLNGDGFPSGAGGNFFMTLDKDSISYERVLCSGRIGNVFTIAADGRGVDGTVATDHALNASAEHTWSAIEATQLSQHVSKTKDVHGVTSNIVGINDTQTLANKSLTEPTIASYVNAGHDHSNATKGGNIPQASVTGLVSGLAGINADIATAEADIVALEADVATRQLSSQKGQANGYASLDASTLVPTAQIPSIPFAKLPTGTGASEVAVGNHTHDAVLASTDNSLTSQALASGDVGIPRTLATTDSLPAGTYLITASCAGFSCASGGSPTRLIWSLATNVGTLYTGPIRTINDTVQTVAGAAVVGILVNASAATVTFRAEKDNDSGTVATTSTSGHLTATRLTDLT